MIYLVYGKDWFRSREKIRELLEFFRVKIGSLGIFRIEGDDFDPAKLEELIRSQMLFEKKYIVFCDKIFENLQAHNFVEKNIEKIAATPNIFLFLEEELDKKLLDMFKKYSKKVQEFKVSYKPHKEISFGDYNPFAICDAVAEKNKSRAWILFQKALLSGVPAEEVFYKIVWQVKNLLLIKKLSTAGVKNIEKETELHPYVVKKNLWSIKNFTEQELINYSFKLLKIYHDVRRGLEEFPLGLEKFLINI